MQTSAPDILRLFESRFEITIDDLERLAGDSYREVSRAANILLDFYDEDRKLVDEFFRMANKAGRTAVKACHGVEVDHWELKRRLLEVEFPSKVTGFFPLPVYVSSRRGDKMTIGLLLHFNGKLEPFEGNDEASTETVDAVNKLLGLAGKRQVVYGMHTEDLVDQIAQTKILPKGLYVSPNRKHASGYWDMKGRRKLFTCSVDLGDLSQESDYDWKILRDTRIKKFKEL